jgi:hypothetical protein
MFKVTRVRRFTHEISVITPVDGGHAEEKLRATFNFLTTDEAAKFDLATGDGTCEFLKKIIVKLDDLVDDKDQPVPYSDEIRDALIALPNVRQALCKGYFDAVLAAKKGN